MKPKNRYTSILKKSQKSNSHLSTQPPTQAQLIAKINAHTRFTRDLVQIFVKQSDSAICRSRKATDE